MGGRERRGRPICPRTASAVPSRAGAAWEELFTATAGGVLRRRNRGREGRHRVKGSGLVFSSLFVRWNGPGGAVRDGDGGIVMDCFRRPWTAADECENL
jgi:hypothetical protein